jgi:hypothetical protein
MKTDVALSKRDSLEETVINNQLVQLVNQKTTAPESKG